MRASYNGITSDFQSDDVGSIPSARSNLILERQDAIYAAMKLMKYFEDFNRIDDYFRARKVERIKNLPAPLFGMNLEDDMFQEYDMSPEDMKFEITTIQASTFDAMLEKTASFSPDENPGKTIKLVVKETNTNTVANSLQLPDPALVDCLVFSRTKTLGSGRITQ